jgi:hypothetical protein
VAIGYPFLGWCACAVLRWFNKKMQVHVSSLVRSLP